MLTDDGGTEGPHGGRGGRGQPVGASVRPTGTAASLIRDGGRSQAPRGSPEQGGQGGPLLSSVGHVAGTQTTKWENLTLERQQPVPNVDSPLGHGTALREAHVFPRAPS